MHGSRSPVALVLGANGRFGRVAVDAFSQAGWRVIAQTRSAPRSGLPGNATALQCDARDTDALLRGCADNVDVIVNALNPAYTAWEKQVPALAAGALELARRTGALLMLPGNVYNFGSALPEVLSETTPQVPDTSKARVRIALEREMEAAAAQGVRSVVIRAGDFLGGPGPGTWLDMVIARKLGKGKASTLGPPDVAHAWAYLPDLAQVFVKVAERREALQAFEVLHYGGLTLTGRALFHALEQATGRRLTLTQMPWWPLRLTAPFVPISRALLEMRYLWQRPHRLDESKLHALIGDVPHTGIADALRASLPRSLLAAQAPPVIFAGRGEV